MSDGLERRIGEWRAFVRRRHAIRPVDVEELEDHLRNQVGALGEAGLDKDEAFLVAVKRLGNLDSLSREFAREYSERLWKQLVLAPDDAQSSASTDREAMTAIALGTAAGVAIKLPELFGVSWGGSDADQVFYARNFSLFVLPFLAAFFAAFFAWKRGLGRIAGMRIAVPFVAAAAIVNLTPFELGGHTELLAVLHLPIALWLVVGVAYVGGRWDDHDQRMNFVRFSGEWFIYYALIAFGGGVLMGFTMFIFHSVGLDVEWIVGNWVLPCGGVGAVVVASWLVEAKQSVIENMAPVLTRLFTPLFTLVLLAFLVTVIWTGRGIDVEREVLIGFDLLLVLVLGLLLYAISARDRQARPGPFDALQLLLVVCALVVDALALSGIAARISAFGWSPNRAAALGENLVLLVNLGWSAWLYARFLKARATFAALERWQTAYLPVYAVWAVIVVVLFPVLFNFR